MYGQTNIKFTSNNSLKFTSLRKHLYSLTTRRREIAMATQHFILFKHHKLLLSVWVISYASPIICCVYRKQVPYFLIYIYKLYHVYPLCNTNKEVIWNGVKLATTIEELRVWYYPLRYNHSASGMLCAFWMLWKCKNEIRELKLWFVWKENSNSAV